MGEEGIEEREVSVWEEPKLRQEPDPESSSAGQSGYLSARTNQRRWISWSSTKDDGIGGRYQILNRI